MCIYYNVLSWFEKPHVRKIYCPALQMTLNKVHEDLNAGIIRCYPTQR